MQKAAKKKKSVVRNIFNIIKLSYQENAFKDKLNLKQNLRQIWLCSLPFKFIKLVVASGTFCRVLLVKI